MLAELEQGHADIIQSRQAVFLSFYLPVQYIILP